MKGLFKKGRHLTFVGAHNPFIARLVEEAGFDGIYLSGAGLSSSLALPDTGVAGLNDFAYAGKNIVRAVSLPVIADADTGFEDAEETVEAYVKAGLKGLHIEDQVFPKRCGHLEGKEVVDMAEMEEKICHAVRRRDKLKADFAIIARTDARGAVNVEEEKQFDEAVRRGRAYVKAGADAIFPESLRSAEEFKRYRSKVDGPLLANMTEFGKTPFITADEFGGMGYQIVIFPVTIFRYLAGEAVKALNILKRDGNQRNLTDGMLQRGEINRIIRTVNRRV